MGTEKRDCIYTTTHHFKTHMAQYIRALEAGKARAVVVKRYDRPVMMVMTMKSAWRETHYGEGVVPPLKTS